MGGRDKGVRNRNLSMMDRFGGGPMQPRREGPEHPPLLEGPQGNGCILLVVVNTNQNLAGTSKLPGAAVSAGRPGKVSSAVWEPQPGGPGTSQVRGAAGLGPRREGAAV